MFAKKMNGIWENVCRVCLQKNIGSMKCLSLFENYENSSVSQHIVSIARVDIKEGDGLPDRICPECLLQLGTTLDFKRKCEVSDNILRGILVTEVPSEFKNEEDISVKDEMETEIFNEPDICPVYSNKELNTDTVYKKNKKIDLNLICDECQGTFKSKCKLRVHWKKVHLAEKLKCPDCKRFFKTSRAYNVHMKQRSYNCITATKVHIEGMGKSRTFCCKDCSYKTKRINNMRAHLVTHTGEKPYECNICLQRFSQISSLSSHREDKHKDYKIQTTCHVCGKNIQGRNKMYRHLLTHRNDQIQCEVCNKMLKHRTSLDAHMKRHSGIKSFSCEQCPTRFYSQSELITHRNKVHIKDTNTYKHRCDMCEYATVRKYALVKHKAKHTGTNIPCLICGAFFDDTEKFMIHKKSHTENKYPCPYCDKKYATSKSRGAHIHTKHKNRLTLNKIAQEKFTVTQMNDIKGECSVDTYLGDPTTLSPNDNKL